MNYLGQGPGWAHHLYCVRHLASNFLCRFHDKFLKMLLVRAAYDRQPCKLEYKVEQLALEEHGPNSWLQAIPLNRWALSRDEGKRYVVMTTNFSEVFKNVLKSARNVPITDCVQKNFYRVNTYFVLDKRQSLGGFVKVNHILHRCQTSFQHGKQANSTGVRVFNFQQNTVKIKLDNPRQSKQEWSCPTSWTSESDFTCQKPQLYGYYYSLLAAC